MKEYIEREAAIDALTERNLVVHMDSVNDGLVASCHRSAQRIIANLPAAEVRPVVLCRDCKHSDTFAQDCTEATFPLKCLSIRYGGVYPNWFCEHGEKREES